LDVGSVRKIGLKKKKEEGRYLLKEALRKGGKEKRKKACQISHGARVGRLEGHPTDREGESPAAAGEGKR